MKYEPSEFSIILGVFPSITATAELVVPVNLMSDAPPQAIAKMQG